MTPTQTQTQTRTTQIVVTRHPALVTLLLERAIIIPGTPVLTHVDNPDQIAGHHVIGVLPLHLAAAAASVTEIPMRLTPADRAAGELSMDRLREIAGVAVTYTVTRHDAT